MHDHTLYIFWNTIKETKHICQKGALWCRKRCVFAMFGITTPSHRLIKIPPLCDSITDEKPIITVIRYVSATWSCFEFVIGSLDCSCSGFTVLSRNYSIVLSYKRPTPWPRRFQKKHAKEAKIRAREKKKSRWRAWDFFPAPPRSSPPSNSPYFLLTRSLTCPFDLSAWKRKENDFYAGYTEGFFLLFS